MLRDKILKPLSNLVDKDEEARGLSAAERKAGNLQEEAFRSARLALDLDDKNVEASAAMVFNYFRLNDFRNAYPYAKGLIENLPSDTSGIDLEDFNEYVIGAYYILARKDAERQPDQALAYLDASLALERQKPGQEQAGQRWRAALVEIEALQKKAELAAKQTGGVKGADQKLKSRLQDYVASPPRAE